MKKSLKITLITVPVMLLIATVGIFSYSNKILNEPNIYSGVKIKDTYVGGLSQTDAKTHLENNIGKSLSEKELTLKVDDYEKKATYGDLEIGYDYDKAIKQAHSVGREGGFIDKLKEIRNVKKQGKNIELEIVKNNEKITEIAKLTGEELYKEPKSATIKYSNGNFLVNQEALGQSVDTEKLSKDIIDSVPETMLVSIPLNADTPKVTSELLSRVKEQIGTYTTQFKLDDQNRVFNVARAANSVDNKLVLPGETFSFNNTTGPRSLKAGYKEATVILNGEFVPGEGGGVCQVSSTMYNTLLNSGVKIVERHSHSLPISYVPKGKDATVSFNSLDLKFRNDYDAPVYIKAYVSGNALTVKMYGDKDAKVVK